MSTSPVGRFGLLCLCGAVLLATTGRAQTTWYVDDDAIIDPGPWDPTSSDPLEAGTAAPELGPCE